MSVLYQLVVGLEKTKALDVVAKPLAAGVSKVVRSNRTVRNWLSGTPTGHPAHPALTDVTLGALGMSTLLDVVGGRSAERSADLLLRVGVGSVVPTAATGLNDWSDLMGGASRVGLVHASSNTTALGLYLASLAARRRGDRGAGKALAVAGLGVLTVGGYLGGHLAFARTSGVNHTALENPPTDWTPVLSDAALTRGAHRLVHAAGVLVLLVQDDSGISAIANTCSHLGGPLNEGEFRDRCVTCPWHGSTFRLEDGEVVQGPATVPQPVYATRVRDGQVEVRLQS
ncbi:MAG: Rieske 2Fe-2S domain-containing protein [Actinomycetes bacterium]